MLETLRHDGPGRLGIFHIEDRKVMTPNFLSTDPGADLDLHIIHGGIASKGASVVDTGSLFSPGGAETTAMTILPDMPVGLDVPRSLAETSVESTLEVARRHPGVPAVICGSRYLDLRKVCAMELEDRPLLALADGYKLLDRPRLLVQILSTVRQTISPNTALYFPLAPPHTFPFLAYLGVDLFDSGFGAIQAARRRICTSRGVVDIDTLKELPCTCQACAEGSPGRMTREDILAHNMGATDMACREIRESMRCSDLRNLVEERAATDARLTAALRIVDGEEQDFLLRHTSTSG